MAARPRPPLGPPLWGAKGRGTPQWHQGSPSPNKEKTGSTRFSYTATVEEGKCVVLVSLDSTALTKEDQTTKHGLEVRVREKKTVNLVRM